RERRQRLERQDPGVDLGTEHRVRIPQQRVFHPSTLLTGGQSTMIKKFNEERGIAMVTALMVSLVVLFLSIVVVALSLHNSTISAFDRKRIQAIDAAEAGIDAWSSGLVTSTGGDVCDATKWDGTLPTTPSAGYDVTITLYSGWPPVPGLPPVGNEMICPGIGQPLATDPLGALIVSK